MNLNIDPVLVTVMLALATFTLTLLILGTIFHVMDSRASVRNQAIRARVAASHALATREWLHLRNEHLSRVAYDDNKLTRASHWLAHPDIDSMPMTKINALTVIAEISAHDESTCTACTIIADNLKSCFVPNCGTLSTQTFFGRGICHEHYDHAKTSPAHAIATN